MLQNKYFEVVEEFLKGYYREIYGSELISKVSLSQKAIALTLIELEEQGILISKSSGNRKYYSLNLVNPLISDYLVLVEKFKQLKFLEKHKNLIDFSKKVKGNIVCVFGSFAKGTVSVGSDLDLLVVGKVDASGIRKLGEKYGIEVQVFNYSISDFKKGLSSGDLVIKECLENHILLSGEELFVSEGLEWGR